MFFIHPVLAIAMLPEIATTLPRMVF